MSEFISKLIDYQREIGVEINVRSNSFKKDGDTHKTKSYLKARFVAISALCKEFTEINTQILSCGEEATATQYHEKNYFGEIHSIARDLIGKVKKCAETKFAFEISATAMELELWIDQWRHTSGIENPNADDDGGDDYEEPNNIVGEVSQPQTSIGRPHCMPPEPPTLLAAARIKFNHRKNVLSSLIEQTLRQLESAASSMAQLKQKQKLLDNYWNGFVSAYEELIQVALNLEQLALEYVDFESQRNNNQQPNIMKLKPIEIPKFRGDYENWFSFRDLFSNLYHNNPSLTGSEKLHYLKSSLDGDAARLISHLQSTDANYESAWQIITSRYENKRLLVNRQLEMIWSLQNIQTESTFHLKKMHDTVREALHALKNFEVNYEIGSDSINYTD